MRLFDLLHQGMNPMRTTSLSLLAIAGVALTGCGGGGGGGGGGGAPAVGAVDIDTISVTTTVDETIVVNSGDITLDGTTTSGSLSFDDAPTNQVFTVTADFTSATVGTAFVVDFIADFEDALTNARRSQVTATVAP